MTATHRLMPEPRRGEPADEYRVRLREFIDFHASPFETIESSRRSWVDICSRHEVVSGLDFTPDDPRPAARVPSPLPEPSKPIVEMSREEHDAFAWETWCAMGRKFYEPRTQVPVVVTSADLDNMLVEICGGMSWGSARSGVPRTHEHHSAWKQLADDIAEIHALGGTVELDCD